MAYPDAIGGGTLADMGSGNLANYMPVVWARKALAFVEKELVCFNLFNRDYEKDFANGGDTVRINPLLEITATAVNTDADPTVYDTDQGAYTDLIINYWYEAVVGVNDAQSLMGVPDYETQIIPKLSYAIAKQMDTSVNALFDDFSQSVGTEGQALSYENLLKAKAYLDQADAPMEGRVLIIDPESLEDLMALDIFISADYQAGGAVSKGFVGQLPTLGCKVYMTTNLTAVNTNYHPACMAHRDALAVAQRQSINLKSWRVEERHTTMHRATGMWGVVELRDTFGVWIKTRS